MPFANDAITIDCLHLRGEEHSARETVRAIQRLRPPDTGQRWYLIRQVSVKTRPEAVARQLIKSVDQHIRQAVHGSQANAHQANAVFFDSLAELLKQLSLDLHRGRSEHWYWQQWLGKRDAPTATRLSQLWCQHARHLPEICLFLAYQDALVQIWQAFSRDQILAMGLAYCQALGLDPRPFLQPCNLTAAIARSNQPHNGDSDSPSPSRPTTPSTPLALTQLMRGLPTPLRHSWGKIVTEQHDQTEEGARLASISLALLLSTTSWQPTCLPAWQRRWPDVIDQWIKLLSAPSLPPQSYNQVERPHTPPQSATSPSNADPVTHTDPATPTTAPPHTAPPPRGDTRATQENRPASDEAVEPPCATATQQGGLFLLINLIIRFLRQQPESPPVLHQPHAGWALLWQLGQLLAPNSEAALSRDEGLRRLFSRLLDDEKPFTRLSAIDLGPMPRTLADAITSQPRLAALCGPALLQRHAQIHLDQSHMDIYLSNQSIELEIRIAGLDIDPGWVDWLGRVVSFHYRDEEARHGHD